MHLELFADASTLPCGFLARRQKQEAKQQTKATVRWPRRLLMTRWWVASRTLSDPLFLGWALSQKLGFAVSLGLRARSLPGPAVKARCNKQGIGFEAWGQGFALVGGSRFGFLGSEDVRKFC